jgi:hypothetical protein
MLSGLILPEFMPLNRHIPATKLAKNTVNYYYDYTYE